MLTLSQHFQTARTLRCVYSPLNFFVFINAHTLTLVLQDDLYDVVSEGFDFEGHFYYQSTDPAAPNPSLSIEGTGPIGLPLSEDNAKLLISKASRAPFGRKEETVIDPAVRDTWEIDPAKVVFRNAEWAKYVDKVASDTVWTALGVAKWTSKPRCELHKLLIYETGSQ